MREKRSSEEKVAQLPLFSEGVGGRQKETPIPAGGGGYPKKCAAQKFEKGELAEKKSGDPRFSELKEIGLPDAWMMVARIIGFDKWMEVWKAISDDDALRHDGGSRMPKLRDFSAYRRLQRNRYIGQMAAANIPAKLVLREVRQQHGEWLDQTTVMRIMRQEKQRGCHPYKVHIVD